MTMTKTLLKNTVLRETSPAEVLREVNAGLWENHESNMVVSVWLGILELSTGTLIWADAGHVRPLVRQNGRWSFLEKAQSPALGSVDPEAPARNGEAPFADHQLQMRPGDVLFQYTDGITEAANPQKTAFGEEGLLAAMSRSSAGDLKETAEQLRQKIDDFVKPAAQSDDITMLLVRYNGLEQD
jgi:sigma-B regulation protein RsbU (phosphoserine phosphatase)